MIKVLFAAGEAAPFIKTGGLGDVVASLPLELRRQGVDARVIIPKYAIIPDEFKREMSTKAVLSVPLAWRNQYCAIEELIYNGIPFYFVDNEYYFKRGGVYGHYDDAERYSFFAKAVLEALPQLGFQPHIIHSHDWHSSMISVFLSAHYRQSPFYEKIRTLLTIHNLKYQGIFPKSIVDNLLGLDWNYFSSDGIEFYDKVNFMKGGLVFSDLITTVSPSYAQEIQSPYFGEKLEGVLRQRAADLFGIVNGIDHTTYNPVTDSLLFTNYDRHTIAKKKQNKLALQKTLGLEASDKPMLAMVSRLVEAKGFDLLLRVLPQILAGDVQLVITGQGDEDYQHRLCELAREHQGQFACVIPYSEDFAHKIFAAADLFLMPSRYEPCGLGQLIAMRYGCIPVVRETGGLKDTVIPYNKYTGTGNGFSFTNYNAHDMLHTLRYALEIYRNNEVWHKMIERGMVTDNSWQASAAKYRQLYNRLYLEEYIYKAGYDTSAFTLPTFYEDTHTIPSPLGEATYEH